MFHVVVSVSASVVGLIAITSLQIIRSSVAKNHQVTPGQSIGEANPLSVSIFICTLYVLIHLKHRAVNIFVVIGAAIVGQVFYIPQ